MKDTPKHIKEKQLAITELVEVGFLKHAGERLRQAIVDNDALFKFWNAAKKGMAIKNETR